MTRIWTDEQLSRTLSDDALHNAEQITGGSIHSDKETQDLGILLHIRNIEAKRKMLGDAGDSHFETTLEEYLSIVNSIGFEEVLKTPFDGMDGRKETHRVMADVRRGIILSFDTFSGDSVNGGHFYYNWRPSDLNDRSYSNHLSSGHWTKDGVWVGGHDCREAIAFNIRRLEQRGSFVTPWLEQPWMWLLHYGEKGEKDYKTINQQRISLLPEPVRKAICA